MSVHWRCAGIARGGPAETESTSKATRASTTVAPQRPDIGSSVPAGPGACHPMSGSHEVLRVNACALPSVEWSKEGRSMFKKSVVALSLVGLLAGTGVALAQDTPGQPAPMHRAHGMQRMQQR